MRFNPPPSWPPVPPGWTPDAGWRPDPCWPPAPPGWQFWVDDAAPQQNPYQNPYLPGYPPPYPVPRPVRSRGALRLVPAALLAVAVLVGGSLWYFSGDHGTSGGTTATGAAKSAKKHDITTLTKDLLLDRSQFSGFDGGEWHSDMSSTDAIFGSPDSELPMTTTPADCGYGEQMRSKLLSANAQTASSTLAGTDPGTTQRTSMSLTLPAPNLDMTEYLHRCPEYTTTSEIGDQTLTQRTTFQQLNLSSLPQWATAYSMKVESDAPIAYIPPLYGNTVMILGTYRAVLLSATEFTMSHDAGAADPDVSDRLAQLFNAQVAKLEAAP